MPVYVVQKENDERCKCTLNRNLLLHITDTLDQSDDLDQLSLVKKKNYTRSKNKKGKEKIREQRQ